VSTTPGQHTTDVAEAGSVRWEVRSNGELRMVSVSTNSGWTFREEEDEGSELRVVFSTPGARRTFEAERQDGRIEVSISHGASSE
jgi:hypothetical protein